MNFIFILYDKIVDKLKRVDFKNNSVLEIILVGLMLFAIVVGIVGGILFLIYCIYYAIAWVGFWLFGPVIFGYTMTWKTPIMLWFVVVILRVIFSRNKA